MANQFVEELIQRKESSEQFNKKKRNQDGSYKEKNIASLAWRRYCKFRWLMEDPDFHVICCGRTYSTAAGLITHVHRKH